MKDLKDYYEIFGLKEGATLEEIVARWMELKEKFQSKPRKNEATRRAFREINEAYEVLKGSVPFPVDFDMRRFLREAAESRRAKKEETRKKIIISSFAILAICLIIGAYIFISERSRLTTKLASTTQDDLDRKIRRFMEEKTPLSPSSQAPETVAKVLPQEPRKTDIPEITKPVPDAPPPLKATPPVEVIKKAVHPEPSKKVKPEIAKPVLASLSPLKTTPPVEVTKEVVPSEPSKKVSPEAARPVPPAPPVEVAKVIPPEPGKNSVPEAASSVPPAPPASKPAPPAEVAKVAPQEPTKTTPPPPPTELASEGEVKQFLASYINSYNNKSIDGFILFFSPMAVQNQRDNLDKIRKTYDSFFNQMETVQYRVTIREIKPQKNSVEVRGQYQLDGVLVNGRKKQNWKGQVGWVLVREEGDLKILSLDYQPQK